MHHADEEGDTGIGLRAPVVLLRLSSASFCMLWPSSRGLFASISFNLGAPLGAKASGSSPLNSS